MCNNRRMPMYIMWELKQAQYRDNNIIMVEFLNILSAAERLYKLYHIIINHGIWCAQTVY